MIVEKAREIRSLLSRGKIDEAFRLLNNLQASIKNKQIRQSVVVQNAAYQRLKQEKLKGVLDYGEYSTRLNKIIDSVTQLVDSIIEYTPEEKLSIPESSDKRTKNYFLISSILLNLILLTFISIKCTNDSEAVFELDCQIKSKLDLYSINGKLKELQISYILKKDDDTWKETIRTEAEALGREYNKIVDLLKNESECFNYYDIPFFAHDMTILLNILADIDDDKKDKLRYANNSIKWNDDYGVSALKDILEEANTVELENEGEYIEDIETQNLEECLELQRVISSGILYLEGNKTVREDMRKFHRECLLNGVRKKRITFGLW